MTGLRIVYLEDREKEFERWSTVLTKCLSFGSFHSEIDWAADEKTFLSALLRRPHIAVCDMDLGDGSLRYAGAQIISRVKNQFPDVLFFLLTGQNVSLDKLAGLASPDHYLSKEYLGTDEYNRYLKSVVAQLLRRYPVGELAYSFDLRMAGPAHSKKVKLSEAELQSMAEQCLYGVDLGTEGTDVGKVELSPIPGGFSGSGVYLMHIWTGSRKNSVPSILKISELSRARAELSNYNRFVKWRLPYLWRVDLMGFGSCGNFGAICYSFVMGGGKEPSPANHFLRRGQLSVVDAVVDSILFSKNQNWYSECRPSEKDARIYFGEQPYYTRNARRADREQMFKAELRKLAQSGGHNVYFEESTFAFSGRPSIPNLNRCLFNRDWGMVTECVCHGDLNGNNVMYTGEGNEVAFIDFQHTGFHHLFRDFVSFESSVRLEIPGEDQHWAEQRFPDVLNGEERLVSATWDRLDSDGTYIGEISKIRHAANQNFPSESFALYLIANTVHSLWLLEKGERWPQYQKHRLLAAVVAGLEGLDRLARER